MPTEYITNRYMAKQGIPPQQVTWNDQHLTFDEISKFFTIPAVEAASILGVCTSTLKRICNENGIPRWPYRKIMAGKSIEEIKREALNEQAATQHPSVIRSSGQSTLQSSAGSGRSDTLAVQNLSQIDSRLATMVRSNAVQSRQQSVAARYTSNSSMIGPHGIQRSKPFPPTFLDEFKQGFPSDGLLVSTNRWWGNRESKSEIGSSISITSLGEIVEAGCLEPDGSVHNDKIKTGGLQDEGTEERVREIEGSKESALDEHDSMAAASLLVKLRKKAAISGRRALRCAITRGYNYSMLTDNDASTLKFVFENNLPSGWKDSFSPS